MEDKKTYLANVIHYVYLWTTIICNSKFTQR